MRERRKLVRLVVLVATATLSALLMVVYVRTHPLVFMDTHVHCIKCAGLDLETYASQNGGRLPYHPKGYGNALLLMNEESYQALTGPGYDALPFLAAKRAGKELREEECG